MSTKIIECHDCAKEIKIKDTYEELEVADINCCPLCASENIDVNESK